MNHIALISHTTKEEKILIEAARSADESGATIHVVYLIPFGWLANLEITLAERIGIPVGLDTIRSLAERKAATVAEPILEEYVAVGLIGKPTQELLKYAEEINAEKIFIDADSRLSADVMELIRTPQDRLRGEGFQVISVR